MGSRRCFYESKTLTLEERIVIATELSKGSSFKAIGALLNKDSTTISREVRAHVTYEKKGSFVSAYNPCKMAYLHACKKKHVCQSCSSRHKKACWSCGKCTCTCPDFEFFKCPRLLKAPYVCNGCKKKKSCVLEKAVYDPASAQKEYEALRSDARSGFNICEDELRVIDALISPLIKKGQSIHHIVLNHADELNVSERTLYTYVGSSLFEARNLDMPRVVRMKPRKKKSVELKVDKKCRIGRTMEDFYAFMKEHPITAVVQMDSVEGKKGGLFF